MNFADFQFLLAEKLLQMVIHALNSYNLKVLSSTSYTENRKTFHFCVDSVVSVNFCDILTPHDAVTENPQKLSTLRNFTNPIGWRHRDSV
jgi:hypothetical protein